LANHGAGVVGELLGTFLEGTIGAIGEVVGGIAAPVGIVWAYISSLNAGEEINECRKIVHTLRPAVIKLKDNLYQGWEAGVMGATAEPDKWSQKGFETGSDNLKNLIDKAHSAPGLPAGTTEDQIKDAVRSNLLVHSNSVILPRCVTAAQAAVWAYWESRCGDKAGNYPSPNDPDGVIPNNDEMAKNAIYSVKGSDQDLPPPQE